MLDRLEYLYEQLNKIETRGESTKKMCSCLWGLEAIILDVKEREKKGEPPVEGGEADGD